MIHECQEGQRRISDLSREITEKQRYLSHLYDALHQLILAHCPERGSSMQHVISSSRKSGIESFATEFASFCSKELPLEWNNPSLAPTTTKDSLASNCAVRDYAQHQFSFKLDDRMFLEPINAELYRQILGQRLTSATSMTVEPLRFSIPTNYESVPIKARHVRVPRVIPAESMCYYNHI